MKLLNECHILVTPASYGQHDAGLKTELEAAAGRVTYNETGKPLSSAQLAALLPGVDGLIAGLDTIDAAALAAADSLRVVARYGVGTDNVDLAAARARGIVVTNTPGANAGAVAELAVTLLLLLARPVLGAAAATREGGWPRTSGLSLGGKTVGLVGFGAIGRAVARLLSGFGCRVLAYDPHIDPDQAAELGVTVVELEQLVAASDFVSLHAPATPQTRGLVNAEFLARMKPGAALVNTARGELVDEAVLHEALVSGRLRGAALDAFAHEPPGAANPLLSLPNVIATPHMGAHTDDATTTMGRMALADCLAVLRGEEPVHRVM
ncbi:MAG TPA: phosphoglycerate dehydrogenase [Promineifilum sp.]|nr:phosphoglycerate dehydrogenase [Promineifilum sp.]HRO91552.1 phosphoglycerate dehydrogenase [Promineifilum sp.]